MFSSTYYLTHALKADERAKAAPSEEWRRLWVAEAADWRTLGEYGEPAPPTSRPRRREQLLHRPSSSTVSC